MLVAGLLEQGEGSLKMAVRLVVRPAGLRSGPEVEEHVGFPARVAKRLRKGQRLLKMISGLLVLALFVAQDADHEIGVGHVAAAAHRAEHLPATRQEYEGIRRLSLLPAYLGEKECRLGLAVMIAESPAQPKDPLEAGCGVVQPALPPVAARESGQAVGFPPGYPATQRR